MNKRLLGLAVVLVLAAGMSMAAGSAKEGSWTGWVTDSMCGAKADNNPGHAACAKQCVEGHGAKYALYNPSDKKVYVLDPQDKAAAHAGHHVTVKGIVEGDTIKVTSIEVVPDKKG